MEGRSLHYYVDSAKQNNWNKFVTENGGSFLQSWEWGDFQEARGRKIWRIGSSQMAALITEHKLPYEKRYLYAPRGPVLINEYPETLKRLVDFVKKELSKETIFLRLEPVPSDLGNVTFAIKTLRSLGFVESIEAQPEHTLVIDLTKSEKVLFKEMEQGTRYAIKTALKRNITIETVSSSNQKKSFDEFWKLFRETNTRHKLKAYPKAYYESVLELSGGIEADLFVAKMEDGKVLSSAIIIYFGKTAIYLYSASASGFGRYNAPTLLLWQAIMDAKRRGCSVFDFWGVSEQNPRWSGITAYKKSFGGFIVTYPGTWDLPLNKLWYGLYRASKKLKN
ncbi:MAG: hypothetical protein COU07_00520 [Candidatus Harrisonbacteria bacterium CG10_big_fil_rev_8_21_14_0_10_40_38]|uniref:N-acetyltransferase domain-containing protein n=1 Tax=Candidatus Harrisonbacteria bacterium CG10_big_fil_rev_8_21_14_0_10_40_38 TaxID=1974583 RepID=A0A2H0USI2_9BACT|nr:MAG: hypothetical protein COU07_00520 [Candidatus Harrisonbacteria bacterium CG10_big_fil_rev_8_21_14_0_10_40_38]